MTYGKGEDSGVNAQAFKLNITYHKHTNLVIQNVHYRHLSVPIFLVLQEAVNIC